MREIELALTFDDVLIVPGHSAILPKEANLDTQLTRNIRLNIPLLSAAMDSVTEAAMAIAMAQEGGIGIIHKNMTIEAQAQQVSQVKKFESGIVKEPLTVTPKTTVRELLAMTEAHHFSGTPVVEGESVVGIVTSRDLRFATELDQPVANVMTPKTQLVTVNEGASRETIFELLHKHRIEKLLVVNDDFNLRGMITVKDIKKAEEKPLAAKDELGQLRVGAAIGTSSHCQERAQALVKAGVDVLVVDTAHGHAQSVIDCVAWLKQQFPETDIIAGNVATAEAATALVNAGADAIKVGIGPGSICTTRVVSGVGMPQVTALQKAAKALKVSGVPIIADGGIRYSGDIAKAIVAGASTVMMGSLFAGTDEAPGEVELYKGRSFKSYRGMGSIGAMAQAQGSSDRYFQDNKDGANKLVPQGIEGRVPYKGTVLNILHQLMGGLRSAMGYIGSATIVEMQQQGKFIRVTSAGVREGHVHDVSIIKEPPNYRLERE
ncbi:MAG: IMP dehydrogenase [Gammaproteobacteria bacterium]|nr:IMP dehydrogenase [Gammaproteobacteria bacterium]